MKSGSRPRRPASCKSFKMPNFQVVSYAFSRSKNIAVACCFWIKDSKHTSWSVVLWPLRKPLCVGVIILFLSRYQTSLLLWVVDAAVGAADEMDVAVVVQANKIKSISNIKSHRFWWLLWPCHFCALVTHLSWQRWGCCPSELLLVESGSAAELALLKCLLCFHRGRSRLI